MKTTWIWAAGLVGAAGVSLALAHGGRAVEADSALAGAFEIDAVHSSVMFKISHLGVSNFYGRFNGIAGSFTLDAEKPESGIIDVTIDSGSVDTNNEDRDKHLKTADFFNSGQFPTMTFKSKSIAKGDAAGEFAVVGDLTANGKSKEITIKVAKIGEATLPRFGHRAGLESTVIIKRADFGISYMPGMLGDDVTLIVSLEGTAKDATKEGAAK